MELLLRLLSLVSFVPIALPPLRSFVNDGFSIVGLLFCEDGIAFRNELIVVLLSSPRLEVLLLYLLSLLKYSTFCKHFLTNTSILLILLCLSYSCNI